MIKGSALGRILLLAIFGHVTAPPIGGQEKSKDAVLKKNVKCQLISIGPTIKERHLSFA